MTEQDVKLLLLDLCARLPYGVKIQSVKEPDKTFAKIELYDNTVKNNNPSKIELSFDSFYSDNPYVEMIDYE